MRHVLRYERPDGTTWHVSVNADDAREARKLGDAAAKQLNADNPGYPPLKYKARERDGLFPQERDAQE